MIAYIIGIAGCWLFCDGLISMRLYLNSKDETGRRTQCWLYDHSIRIIRGLIGIFLMIAGYVLR